MRAKALLRGGLWSIFVLLIIAHLGGGWFFSGELIEDGFTPDPDSIILPEEGFGLMEVTYASPLGDLEAWHIPADGTTWVIHVHGKGATPAEAEHLFAPLPSRLSAGGDHTETTKANPWTRVATTNTAPPSGRT